MKHGDGRRNACGEKFLARRQGRRNEPFLFIPLAKFDDSFVA
jgi:hypothetical protein